MANLEGRREAGSFAHDADDARHVADEEEEGSGTWFSLADVATFSKEEEGFFQQEKGEDEEDTLGGGVGTADAARQEGHDVDDDGGYAEVAEGDDHAEEPPKEAVEVEDEGEGVLGDAGAEQLGRVGAVLAFQTLGKVLEDVGGAGEGAAEEERQPNEIQFQAEKVHSVKKLATIK